MLLVLSLVAASTRLLANYWVSKGYWYGWPMKVPSMVIFTVFNVMFGLWGMHLLTFADLWVTVAATRDWRRNDGYGWL